MSQIPKEAPQNTDSCTLKQMTKEEVDLMEREGNGGRQVPDLMTEEELVHYLRIPEVSRAKNPHNVVENLKRMHDLPRIHICNRVLYPLKAVRDWIEKKTKTGE